MDTYIIKRKVEEFCKRNGITVKDMLKTRLAVSDSSFYRMLKEASFKVKFVEQLADIINISIDELIGRVQVDDVSAIAEGNAVKKVNHVYYTNLILQKDMIIADKEKLINLYEHEIKRLKDNGTLKK